MPPPPPTPWTRQAAAAAQPKQPKKSGQQQQPHHAQPSAVVVVSPAVKALQTLISQLENPPKNKSKSALDEDEGCFCQARTHTLSPHTPQCAACGLVLCARNPPFRPCPYTACAQPLLTAPARRALVAQLRAQAARVAADEEDARRRVEEERARAVGAFPELGAGNSAAARSNVNNINNNKPIVAAAKPSSNYTAAQQEQQFHKVLSLSGKGRVTATYTRISPSPSSTSIAKQDDQPPKEEVVRVPPPLEGPEYHKRAPSELNLKKRVFENFTGEGPVYVPLPKEEKVTSDARGGPGRRRRPRNKGSQKRQGKENQPQLLEAGPSSTS